MVLFISGRLASLGHIDRISGAEDGSGRPSKGILSEYWLVYTLYQSWCPRII